MNPVETFGEFSKRLTTTDLMLYAGVGLVLWVLFKDQLTPIQKLLSGLFAKNTPVLPSLPSVKTTEPNEVFFDLVSSWKRTRDLAALAGCQKAVDAADQMFPHLSPVTCKEKIDESATLQK